MGASPAVAPPPPLCCSLSVSLLLAVACLNCYETLVVDLTNLISKLKGLAKKLTSNNDILGDDRSVHKLVTAALIAEGVVWIVDRRSHAGAVSEICGREGEFCGGGSGDG